MNFPPLFLTNPPCLKDYFHNLTKYEIIKASIIPISQLFSKLGKSWKYCLDLYSTNPILYLFPELGKLKNLLRGTFKNSKIAMLILKNLELPPKSNSQKSQF